MSDLSIAAPKAGVSSYRAVVAWAVYLAIGVVYFYFSARITGNIFKPSDTNYYTYLLEAFVHGRVNVTPPSTYDLSFFQDKWYLYWGPAPVLLIWPFYLIWHIHTSDVLYTALAGLANVGIIFLCIREMKRYFNLSLSLAAEILLLLSFAFASPNFFLSLSGQIWFSSQIFAMLYLFLFYLFFFKYLNSGKQYHILLSVGCFFLACLTRYSLIFHGLLLLYLFWDSKVTGKKLSLRLFVEIGVLSLCFVGVLLLYNYLRFGSILEVGQRFQEGSARYDAAVKSGRTVALQYFWYNVYYYFLNPIRFAWEQHPIKIDAEGNSVLMVYPVMLLSGIVFFKLRQFDAKKRIFVWIVSAATLIVVAFLMFYFATGWVQFGNRYFYDAFPLFFLLAVIAAPSVPTLIQLLLVLWGMIINFGGVLSLFGK